MYDLGIGKGEATIVKRATQNRQPIPPEIIKQPFLKEELLFYYQAFLDLCSERNKRYIIPVTAIQRYAAFFKLSESEYIRLHKFVNILNSEAVEHESKKASANNEKN